MHSTTAVPSGNLSALSAQSRRSTTSHRLSFRHSTLMMGEFPASIREQIQISLQCCPVCPLPVEGHWQSSRRVAVRLHASSAITVGRMKSRSFVTRPCQASALATSWKLKVRLSIAAVIDTSVKTNQSEMVRCGQLLQQAALDSFRIWKYEAWLPSTIIPFQSRRSITVKVRLL